MSRRKCCRTIAGRPPCRMFKPVGVPIAVVDEVVLAVDEFEAIRLADFEGLYHEEAAGRMKVSRPTFGRILETARRKVARALVDGLVIRIEGEETVSLALPTFQCRQCRKTWSGPSGAESPGECPACKSRDLSQGPGGVERDDCPRGPCPKP